MSRSRRHSSSNNSAFEQHFIMQNAFKRNKRYINMQKLSQVEHDHKTSRRRPFSSSEKSIDQKINSSFMNTTAAFSDKVEHDIDKFKLRMSAVSGHEQFNLDQSQKSSRAFFPFNQQNIRCRSARSLDGQQIRRKKYSIVLNSRIRGMALDKYCSRQQYYQNKSKPVHDQRLFNNYSEQQPDLFHTKDFAKYLERNLDFAHKNFHELQYNTQKLYQDYYYRKTTMQCNFNYKKEQKTPRQFFTPRRAQHQAATELSPQDVKKSYEKCTVLKPKNIECFYSNTGKQLPSQLDMRFNTNLTNHWVDKRGKIVRKTKQYSLRKMKNDLVDARISQIKQRKKPKFTRVQLCDDKYFRVHPIS